MTMNHIRSLAIGTMLIFALATVAQQTTTQSAVPSVEKHLQVLAEKLDLTSDQQAKIKPMVQELHDTTEKLVQDQTLSPEERHARMRLAHEKADKEVRTVLNDDQKKKLDQLEHEPHPELHGNQSGATSPQN
jgi:chromosome segregation ATPase